MSLNLAEIGQVALTIQDVARAKNFYHNVLGMQFLFAAGQLLFFQCGSIRLMLSAAEKPGPVRGTVLYYRVPDIETAYAELTSQGVIFIEPPHLIAKMPDHDLWLGVFQDSEGNMLSLMSEVPHALQQ